MRNCLCIILFLVLGLTIPATSVYAYGDGGGRDQSSDDGDPMTSTGSVASDETKPPTGFTPATQESADSEIATSSETDPGKEEEVAELVEEVNTLEETAQEEEVEGESNDDSEEGNVEDDTNDTAGGTTSDTEEKTEEGGPPEDNTQEGDVEGDTNDTAGGTTSDEKIPDGNTPAEDQGDKKTGVASSVDDIDPHGSTQENTTTTGQPNPGQNLIGSQGTLPGTRSATLESISTEKNEDGSVSTWAIYSNDTWVRTTVNPDGTNEVSVILDSGTVIRPGREYIHTGGSLNPLLDYTITALEVAAAAGTAAGWVLTVTPAGALASGGVKSAQAVWVATTGIQAVRAGADVYGQKIDEGASQGEAVYAGTKQAAVNAVVVTQIGKRLGEPYEEAIGSFFDETGKVVTEVAVKNYGNFAADGTTKNITGHSPGYKPW